MNQKRIEWIDIAKGIAMFSVVLCHVVNGYNNSGLFSNASSILYGMQNVANSFQMALFCMMSGYLFQKAYIDSDGSLKKEKIQKQILNLLIIYCIWCVIMGLFKMLFNGHVNNEVTIKDLLLIWCKPIGVYWYLYVLIFLYLIFINERIRAINDKIALLLFVICGLCGSILPDDILNGYFFIRRILYYAFIFYLGIVIAKGVFRCDKWWTIVICGIVGIGCIIQFWSSDVEVYHIPIVNLITAISLCLFIIGICSKIGKGTFFRFLGANSLLIYLMHVFVTAGSRVIINTLGIKNVFLSVFITLIASLYLPIIVGYIAKKCKVYNWFVKPYSTITICLSNKEERD